MTISKHLSLMLVAAFFLSASQAMAGHLPGERHTWRTVFSVAGAFGGALVGGAAGYDASSINQTRNITMGLVFGGVGGGVGGFFLGRLIDKSRARNNQPVPTKPDPNKPSQQSINEAQARAMDIVAREFAARLRAPHDGDAVTAEK